MTGTVRVEGSEKVLATIQRVKDACSIENIDRVVDRAALETFAALVQATPQKWFGQVRKSWAIQKPEPGARIVRNDNKIMLWLEEGTKAHGPKELFGPLLPNQKRKKNSLFIPLTRRAVGATDGIFGVGTSKGGPAIFVPRGGKKGGQTTLRYGIDYILTKWVKGIKARHIVAKERPKAQERLKNGMKALVAKAVHG